MNIYIYTYINKCLYFLCKIIINISKGLKKRPPEFKLFVRHLKLCGKKSQCHRREWLRYYFFIFYFFCCGSISITNRIPHNLGPSVHSAVTCYLAFCITHTYVAKMSIASTNANICPPPFPIQIFLLSSYTKRERNFIH